MGIHSKVPVMLTKTLSVLFSAAIALGATSPAAAVEVDPKIAAAVRVINPDATIHSVRDLPGVDLKEVTANNSVVYMDPEGRYLFFGTLLDLEQKRNLSEEAQTTARVLALDAIPDDEKIIYEPSNVLHRVTVFTDISCTFCERLHQHMAEYNDRGIAIEYVAFPRGGDRNPAWAQMQAVWCADDKKAAYDAAFGAAGTAGAASCADPVAKHYELGESLDIRGTPAIFTASGRHIGGFLEPDRMLIELEREKQSAATAAAAGGK